MGEEDTSVEFYTYDLYGHRVTFDYKASTDEDEKIIDSMGGFIKHQLI